MSKKLTVQNLLKEVRELKKLASRDWLVDQVIEYEDPSEVRGKIEQALSGMVSPYRITDIQVNGDMANVTYTRTQPVRLSQIEPWWKDEDLVITLFRGVADPLQHQHQQFLIDYDNVGATPLYVSIIREGTYEVVKSYRFDLTHNQDNDLRNIYRTLEKDLKKLSRK